jgi:hypothetical protein
MSPKTECYRLHPELFAQACAVLGYAPTRDAFASEGNQQCPLYWDRDADALDQPWGGEQRLYMNPPFSMMGRVVQKILAEGATVMIVFPVWTTASWWQALSAHVQRGLILSGRVYVAEDGSFLPGPVWPSGAAIVDGAAVPRTDQTAVFGVLPPLAQQPAQPRKRVRGEQEEDPRPSTEFMQLIRKRLLAEAVVPSTFPEPPGLAWQLAREQLPGTQGRYDPVHALVVRMCGVFGWTSTYPPQPTVEASTIAALGLTCADAGDLARWANCSCRSRAQNRLSASAAHRLVNTVLTAWSGSRLVVQSNTRHRRHVLELTNSEVPAEVVARVNLWLVNSTATPDNADATPDATGDGR